MNTAPNIIYEFGPFRIDPDRGLVLRDGQPLAITPKVFEVLLALVRRGHEVVSKDELMQAVWPGRVVEEANLSQCIFVLRKLLGDTHDERRYIVTLPGQGYRFAEQIRTLTRDEPEAATPQDPSGIDDATLGPPAASNTRSTVRKLVFAVIGATAVAIVLLASAYFIRRRAPPAVVAAPTPAVAAIPAKSIAVMPFENLSSNKENAYFVAGMQDMILTKLADIGGLKVISRISTERYPSHPAGVKEIARQLGVATILEGSVQRSGDRVLIDVQLIDANTDSHIWAESYTRTLHDLFGVEGDVAQSIAKTLNAKLTAAEAARVARVPTTNGAALDAYLRGEYDMAAFNRDLVKPEVADAVREYSEAVKLDPDFALAWAHLAHAQVFLSGMTIDDPALKATLKSGAKASIARALTLQPDLADAYSAQGIYDLFATGDWHAALDAFAKARSLQPQKAQIWWWIGYTQSGLGNTEGAILAYQRVQVLDPKRPPIQLADAEAHLHRFAHAETLYRHALALAPDSWVALDSLANLYAYLGDLPRMGALIGGASPAIKANPNFVSTVGQYLTYRRDWVAARKLYAQAKEPQNLHAAPYPIEVLRGDVDWYAGDKAAARAQYEHALPLIQAMQKQHPKSTRWHAELGWVYARLGRDTEALQQGHLALGANDPTSGVVRHAPYHALVLAQIDAQIGRTGEAINILDKLLVLPTVTIVSVPLLKLDPVWDPIRHDPAFQTLLQKYSKYKPAVIPAAPASTAVPPPAS